MKCRQNKISQCFFYSKMIIFSLIVHQFTINKISFSSFLHQFTINKIIFSSFLHQFKNFGIIHSVELNSVDGFTPRLRSSRLGFSQSWSSRFGSRWLQSTFTCIEFGRVLSRGAYFTWIACFYSNLTMASRGVYFTRFD